MFLFPFLHNQTQIHILSPSISRGGFIGGVTMTDQASGFGRGFDVYDDQFTFSFEDMSRDGVEVTQNTLKWIQTLSIWFRCYSSSFWMTISSSPR